MMKNHPRFYELVEKWGFTIDNLNDQKDNTDANIKSQVVEVTLVSNVEKTAGKRLKKKLLPTMTVENLKGLCWKLFKADILSMKLSFRDNETSDVYYDVNENLRQLSFYGIDNGWEIICED